MPSIKQIVILAIPLTAEGKKRPSGRAARGAATSADEGSEEEEQDSEEEEELSDAEAGAGPGGAGSWQVGGDVEKAAGGKKKGHLPEEWTTTEAEALVAANVRKCPPQLTIGLLIAKVSA
jgi:hypothetical protein